MTEPEALLRSKQVAQFVAAGFLRFDGVVPESLNHDAIAEMDRRVPTVPAGTPLGQAYPDGSVVARLLAVPQVRGAVRSLVGPEPLVDHHHSHITPPRQGRAQHLHGDAIIDTRMAFDIQLMYYPHDVTLEMGGTLLVPGSHLRRINESDIGRYQNLRGQVPTVCPAGTVAVLHHGIWHSARQNRTDRSRYMFKIRLNPSVRQLRLWDTADLADSEIGEILGQRFPWYENAAARLEVTNRTRMWRFLTGDDSYDIGYYLTRLENEPT